jgi:hypothetical protein
LTTPVGTFDTGGVEHGTGVSHQRIDAPARFGDSVGKRGLAMTTGVEAQQAKRSLQRLALLIPDSPIGA